MALIAEEPPITLPRGIGEGAAVQPGLGLGLEHPVGARIADREEVADRDVKPDPVVVAAGLEQQHAIRRIGGQPVGQDAAGRARTDHDVVEVAVEPRHGAVCAAGCGPHRGRKASRCSRVSTVIG